MTRSCHRGWAVLLAARLAETRPRLHYANLAIRGKLAAQIADRHQAVVVDLASARVFDDPRLWADDRIHLNAEGHRRAAEAVGQAIGLTPRFDWTAPLPPMAQPTWSEQRLADARWAQTHLLSWIGRRLTGRSSGDGLAPKRPSLAPWQASYSDEA